MKQEVFPTFQDRVTCVRERILHDVVPLITCADRSHANGSLVKFKVSIWMVHFSTVTFQGIEQNSFRGFLLQARLAADDVTPVGTFAVLSEDAQLSRCSPPEVWHCKSSAMANAILFIVKVVKPH